LHASTYRDFKLLASSSALLIAAKQFLEPIRSSKYCFTTEQNN